MGNESIQKENGELIISFQDWNHDALATCGSGLIRRIKTLRFGNGEGRQTEDELYIHIDGDAMAACISEASYSSTFVTAVAFADLSSGVQRIGRYPDEGRGEVLLIVLMDAEVPDHALARAAITATEAVTAAVQDLGLAYGGITASGSLRQNIVIVRNRGSDIHVRGAGNHCKLGELIGSSSIEAVKASADMNGTNEFTRSSIIAMMSAYGYGQDKLFALSGCPDMSTFIARSLSKDSDPSAVATVSAVIHICNEIQWGLVSEEDGRKAAIALIRAGIREPVGYEGTMDILARTVAEFFVDP